MKWMLNNSTFEVTPNRDTTKRVVRVKATLRLTGDWTCVVDYKGKEGRASATLNVKGTSKSNVEK